MSLKEFIELFINADEEVRKAIEQILEEAQRPSESPDLPSDTKNIIE
jgi:hypothetical protein